MSLTPVNTLSPVILTGGTSPRTTTFDAGTLTNGLLLVAVSTQDVDDAVTGVTWNGVAMTALGNVNNGQIYNVFLFGLVAPDNGTQTISISYTGDGTYAGTVWAVSYSASGTPTLGTPVTNSGTGTTASTGTVTCPSGGDVVAFMHHAFSSTDPTLTSSGTSDIATRASNRPYAAAHHNATVDFTWGTISSSQLWGAIGVPISYGGGGGGATPTPAAGAATVSAAGESLAESTVTAAAGAATVSAVGGTLTVITSSAFKNNTGTVLASLTNVTAWVHNPTTGALVVKLTGQTTNASGVLTLNDAAIVSATTYRVVYRNEDDGAEGMETVTAS